ncbi:MAG: Glutamine--fructose-6-phosphate aminotransferase [isomerizing], partial [uncultured Actinomycetospora sp.]
MCGIVGYVGPRPATRILVEGLARLEYRGYDSAGLAVAHRKALRITKAAGRVDDLRTAIGDADSPGRTGIAHTRWATHGEPSERNAHPHTDADGRIAVVHNGILENADELRAKLVADGVVLRSDTDTEVLPHLIARALDDGSRSLEEAVREALRVVEGTYGLVVLDARRPEELVVARNGSPIVLGLGDGEMFVASDVAALVRHTRQVVFLADGEIATLTAAGYEGSRLASPITVDVDDDAYELDGHPDFLSKEIHEQPAALRRVLAGRLDARFATARLDGLRLDPRELRGIRRVTFLGCGSALYAGQIGAGLVEELARIPADAEQASEFRYRNPLVDPETLYVAVSQSGETLDTLAAVEELQRKGGRVVGVVNVVGSAIARQCGAGTFLHAGPEVSVASTKAFSSMATSFALL